MCKGILYRKFPRGPLDSLTKFMQAPPPDREPNCYLSYDPKRNVVHVILKRSIKRNEKYTIDYGLPYWQLFWHHLSIPHQRQLKTQYPDIKFPPLWPPQLLDNRTQARLQKEEWNYALASQNIYDELETTSTLGLPLTEPSMDTGESHPSEPGSWGTPTSGSNSHQMDRQNTDSHDTTTPPTQATKFDPLHWYKRTSEGVDWDHLIRVIDTVFRHIASNNRHKLPARRSVVQYRHLLCKALEHYHKSGTTIPNSQQPVTTLPPPGTSFSDFLTAVRRTHLDGGSVPITSVLD